MAASSDQLSVKERLKQKSERGTVFVMVVLGLLYGFFYLPEPVLKIFQDRFHQIGGILAELGLSAMLAGAIGFIITAQDILATCDLKASKFFRDQYPSKAIKKHYKDCSQEEADYLWFSLFNPWKNADHPRNMSYLFTFQRSYDCRFIFHVKFSFAFFTILAGLTWGITSLFGVESSQQDLENLNYARGLLLFLVIIVTVSLFAFNRLTPSGCWKRWQEINGINTEWVKIAIFPQAPDYKAAVNLLANPTWKSTYGYK